MSVGSHLRNAREEAGLSVEDISQRTKIQVYKIEALERDQFERLPERIYLDGIIRAYAQEVGIDAEPVIKQVNLERARNASGSNSDEAESLDAFMSEKRPVVAESPPWASMPIAFPEESASPLVDPPPEPRASTPAAPPPQREWTKRHASLLSSEDSTLAEPPVQSVPPSRPRSRRLEHVALVLLLLLAVGGWGAYWYERNRQAGASSTESTTASSELDTHSAPETGTAPQPAAPQPAEPPREAPLASPPQRETPQVSPPKRQTPQVSPPLPALPPQSEPAPTAGTAPAPATALDPSEPAVMHDVAGGWTLTTEVDRAGSNGLEGRVAGYEIQIEQAGARITGGGRKISENGSPISGSPSHIAIAGTIRDNRLTLTFTEEGSEQTTHGKLVLLVDDTGTMRGRFSTDPAGTSGLVEAHRMQ